MATVNELPTIENIKQALPPAQENIPLISADKIFTSQSENFVIDAPVGEYFTVHGQLTNTYRANLSKLGGSWNRLRKVWEFKTENLQDVQNLLTGIKSGKVTPDPTIDRPHYKKGPHKPRDSNNGFHSNAGGNTTSTSTNVNVLSGNGQTNVGGFVLPTVNVNPNFQTVGPWHVFVPSVGMTAKIQVDKNVGSYTVISVNGSRTDGYTGLITDAAKKTSQLEVCNGHWQVRGFVPKHSIRFEAN